MQAERTQRLLKQTFKELIKDTDIELKIDIVPLNPNVEDSGPTTTTIDIE